MIKFSDIVANSKPSQEVVWNNPPVVPEKVSAVARELFPTTAKSWAIYQNNYQYITTDQMKQYLESLNNFSISNDTIMQLPTERLYNLTR